jgi:hypothetical protein
MREMKKPVSVFQWHNMVVRSFQKANMVNKTHTWNEEGIERKLAEIMTPADPGAPPTTNWVQ